MGYILADLYVRDVQRSLTFYRKVLGFELRGELTPPDQPAVWGWVSLGGCQVMFNSLASAYDGEFARPAAERAGLEQNRWGVGIGFMFRYAVPDVDVYYARVKEAGAEVLEEIHTASYGWRQFTVADPDGYRLCFSQDAPVAAGSELES